jgi:hypothetical protein
MAGKTPHGLGPDWLLAPGIDLELKQYILLGYLQRVRSRFGEHKLYPHLDELNGHLERLVRLRDRRRELQDMLAGEVVGLDLERAELVRAHREEDALLQVIDDVLAFAIPELRTCLGGGHELRRELAGHIRFGPVGLLPLDAREGYLMLRQGREARVYAYRVPLVRCSGEDEAHHRMRTHYIGSYTVSITHTYDGIRAELVRTNRQLPHPATFVFEADITLPHIETFMPLAKQLVSGQLGRSAA